MEHYVELDAIGVLENSERSSAVRAAHDQLRHYEPYLAPLRREPVNLIDLTANPAALRVWRWYFQEATILGLASGQTHPMLLKNVIMRPGQRTDDELLGALCDEFPPTIVIDGGPFLGSAALLPLDAMLHRVLPGGLFLLPGLGRGAGSESAVTQIAELAQACLTGTMPPHCRPEHPARQADSIIVSDGGVIVRRRDTTRDMAAALAAAKAYLGTRRDADAFERLATYIMRHAGPPGSAAEAVDRAIQYGGESLPRALLRAEIHVALGRPDACEAARTADAWPGKRASHLHRLAKLFEALGDRATARARAEQAAAAEPGNGAIRKTLVRLRMG